MSAFSVDEAALLKAYNISSLDPQQWEDVDHQTEGPLAGTLTSEGGGVAEEMDPLGLRGRLSTVGDDLKTRTATLLSSKSFDPKVFLSVQHPDASYSDLRRGVQNLERAIEGRSEQVRILVEENFDRFVAVKATSDVVYRDMCESFLGEETDYGTREVREIFKLAAHRADQMYLPVLETAVKASKLRSTLGVFEKSKFLFNLPSQLLESINMGKYDQALRDYKKGLFLRSARTGALMPGLPATTPDQVARQRRVFDEVWESVERVMRDMRDRLEAQIKDPSRGVDDHEKSLEILIELAGSDEPAWEYLDYQHSHIVESMRTMYDRALDTVRAAQRVAAKEPSASSLNELLRRQLAKPTYQPNSLASSANENAWTAIRNMIRVLSEYVARSLPGFWKIAKNCMDGKYRKHDSSCTTRASHRSASECRQKASDIVRLYIQALSQFFTLSDVSVVDSPALRNENNPIDRQVPAFVPAGTTVIAACYFAEQIVDEVSDCVTELMAIDVGKDASQSASVMMESLRWRMLEVITSTWIREARTLHLLEDWQPSSSDSPRGHTKYLATLDDLQGRVILSTPKIAAATPGVGKGDRDQAVMSPACRRKFRETVIETERLLFSGIMSLSVMSESELKPAKGRRPSVGKKSALPRNPESRLLYTLAAFDYLRTTSIPKLVTQLANALDMDVSSDRVALENAVEQLDTVVFDDYVSRRSSRPCELIRLGVLQDGFDWLNSPTPTEVRGYMHKVVLLLVEAHAQVHDMSSALVPRVLEALVDRVSETALESFRRVTRFGTGGMLTATLEIEFLNQSVTAFLSPHAKAALSAVYEIISQGYRRQQPPETLQRDLDAMRRLLAESRRGTGVETLCFRSPSIKK